MNEHEPSMFLNQKEQGPFEPEPFETKHFQVYWDSKTKEALKDENLERDLDDIRSFVDSMLGSTEDTMPQKTTVRLFSDWNTYVSCLEKYHPHILSYDVLNKSEEDRPDNAMFDAKNNTVFRFRPTYQDTIVKYKAEMERHGLTERDVKESYRSDVLCGIAHELSHLHPFFGGIGNADNDSKWEQEMVCVFIEDKTRVKYGGRIVHNKQLAEAKTYLQNNEDFPWETAGTNWESWPAIERFVYPWLEEAYGIEKLKQLWGKLFRDKQPLSEAISEIYNQPLVENEKQFKRTFSKEKTTPV